MSNQDKLVTGETTIAELCEMLSGRDVTGLRLREFEAVDCDDEVTCD